MDIQISVVMAVYNEENSIAKAIESILQQTYTNFEFIIIDDCSTDQSVVIIKQYAINDARIKLIQNNQNLKLAACLNLGIENASHDWIARMDADDISSPDRFEKQIAYLQDHPDIDVLSTGLIDITPKGEIFGRRMLPENHNLLAWRTAWTSPAYHATTIFRKDKFNSVGGYDTSQILEDIELWSRMIQVARFACLQEYLYYYRRSHNEYRGILEKRGNATRDICHAYLSEIFNEPISINEFNNLRRAEFLDFTSQLSEKDIVQTNDLLMKLFSILVSKKILDTENLEEVQKDLYNKITRVTLQGENFTQNYGQIFSELIEYDSLVKTYWKRKNIPCFIKKAMFFLLNPKVFFRSIQNRIKKQSN